MGFDSPYPFRSSNVGICPCDLDIPRQIGDRSHTEFFIVFRRTYIIGMAANFYFNVGIVFHYLYKALELGLRFGFNAGLIKIEEDIF